MLRRVVERVEVVVDGLDLGALGDAEAESHEDVLDLAPHRGDHVQAADRARRGVPGSVTSTVSAASRASSSAAVERGLARLDRGLERLARLVGGAADGAALLGRELGDAAQQVRQLGLAAEVGDPRLLELGRGRPPRRSPPRPAACRAVICSIMRAPPYLDFVERDRRRHRGVERLRVDRDVGGRVARGEHVAPAAPRARRRPPACTSPCLRTSQSGLPACAPPARPSGPGSSSTEVTRTTGTEKIAPIDARTAFGPNGSAVPGPSATLAAPNASAERSTVPTLPGSPTPHSATQTGPAGARRPALRVDGERARARARAGSTA